jgi:hypothetical protein
MFKNLQMLNKERQAETAADSSTNVEVPTSNPNAAKPNVVRRFFSRLFCRHNVEKHIYTCFTDRYVETRCCNCGKHIFRDI